MKRLNWIDILVIVVLVGALAFVGYMMTKDPDAPDTGEKLELSAPTLEMVVEIPDLSREIANNAIASFGNKAKELDGIQVPMTRIYNSNKLVDAQIVSWEIQEIENEDLVTVRLTIEANPTVYRCNYTVGTQEVRIGKSFITKTLSVELTGTIVSITELGNE